jgi:hypothetical protein
MASLRLQPKLKTSQRMYGYKVAGHDSDKEDWGVDP